MRKNQLTVEFIEWRRVRIAIKATSFETKFSDSNATKLVSNQQQNSLVLNLIEGF